MDMFGRIKRCDELDVQMMRAFDAINTSISEVVRRNAARYSPEARCRTRQR